MKDTFEIKQTEINPYVLMDIVKGEIIFEGRSLVVYPSEFYEGVMEWINDHEHELKSTAFNLTINMDYVNTSFSSVFAGILKKLVGINSSMSVTWKYELDDTDCFEMGEDYSRMLKKEFTFIEY